MDIQAALGLHQLRRLPEFQVRRAQIAQAYEEAFAGLESIETPVCRPYVEPAWHLYPIRLDLAQLTVRRAEIFRALRAENIGINVHYIPVHLHPYYRDRFGYKVGEFPVAEDAYERLISLPMFHAMTDQDVDDVIQAVRKIVGHYAK